ncbi:MAG: DUF2971 domain-containing protein [Pseudobutyrivibrio sp.]|nr:DUF2971 domain-containing protein [Pseudobutyrivibrio sp.]
MFFINKNNITDFQNRCLVALFLDYHNEIEFDEYVEKNHIKGFVKGKDNPNTLQDIYIFNVPPFNPQKEDRGIVYKYRGRRTDRNFEYIGISGEFIEQYVLFYNNPYDYICRYFKENNWAERYNTLLVSDKPEKMIEDSDIKRFYKYKSDPTNIEPGTYLAYKKGSSTVPSRVNHFMDEIGGTLPFTKPEWLNDPFDCDCEIPFFEVFPSVISAAIKGTKYSAGAVTPIDESRLKMWWDFFDVKDKEHIIEVFKNLVSNEPIGENSEAIEIIKELYAECKKGRMLTDEKAKAILVRFCSIRDRLYNLKNEFRILSLAQTETDILMWAYYANSGQGVCLCHKPGSIHRGIENSTDVATYKADFCIYGEIDYADEKPIFQPSSSNSIDGILEFIVECVFTKSEIWKHEDEYRYVLMGSRVKDSKAICIQSDLERRIMGVKYDEVDFYKDLDNLGGWPDGNVNVDYLVKHPTKYELIKK